MPTEGTYFRTHLISCLPLPAPPPHSPVIVSFMSQIGQLPWNPGSQGLLLGRPSLIKVILCFLSSSTWTLRPTYLYLLPLQGLAPALHITSPGLTMRAVELACSVPPSLPHLPELLELPFPSHSSVYYMLWTCPGGRASLWVSLWNQLKTLHDQCRAFDTFQHLKTLPDLLILSQQPRNESGTLAGFTVGIWNSSHWELIPRPGPHVLRS